MNSLNANKLLPNTPNKLIDGIDNFFTYVIGLQELLDSEPYKRSIDWKNKCIAALDGQPKYVLKQNVKIDDLRATGVFFTPPSLADRMVSEATKRIDLTNNIFFDPTCGVGDLLISAAKKMPIMESLEKTIQYWGNHLAGIDTQKEFIIATKIRLAILAVLRGARKANSKPINLSNEFPYIHVGNALNSSQEYSHSNIILMNPPFSLINPIDSCQFASGIVNSASIFLKFAIDHAKPGTNIYAILPDVLRTGSRYGKWRKIIEDNANSLNVSIVGLFDKQVDVDVFILKLITGNSTKSTVYNKWQISTPHKTKGQIQNICDVRVGTVVPHRDPEKGVELRYLHARNTPAWKTVNKIETTRKTLCHGFTPPFVVIRRTSSPGDKKRAVGTIIDLKENVAVENHLLVLLPKDGKISTCREIIRILNQNWVNRWLNKRIRCRHLTVSSIKELPLRG